MGDAIAAPRLEGRLVPGREHGGHHRPRRCLRPGALVLRPAPKVQVPKAQGGSAWDQATAPPAAQSKPGFPPLPAAGAEVQTVQAPAPVGGGGARRQPEHVRAGPEAAARAMVAAVLKAGNEAALKVWGREGVAHAAHVLGVGPLESGVPGRGRVPVCRALLTEARKLAGGPRAGHGLFLGRS